MGGCFLCFDTVIISLSGGNPLLSMNRLNKKGRGKDLDLSYLYKKITFRNLRNRPCRRRGQLPGLSFRASRLPNLLS